MRITSGIAFLLLQVVPAPAADDVRLPIVRDAWFSQVGREADCNTGGSTRLKLKSNQEMCLVEIDPAPLRGRVVRSAMLHLRLAGDQPLRRVTVGSVGADWVEGTSPSYARQAGSSTFSRRRHPDVPWSFPGSDLCSVILASGGTEWGMADATPPDGQGWQAVSVDPTVVAARVAGLSHGFLVFDDTGSEWKRDGEKFTWFHFPNRFVYSREAGADKAPYLTVVLGPKDNEPPEAPSDVQTDPGELPAGEAWVSWVTPRDRGQAGTAGFFVRLNGQEIPRYLVPAAGPVGQRVRMHLRDLKLPAGAEVRCEARAVDGAGNVGPAASAVVRLSSRTAQPLPDGGPLPFSGAAPLPKLGGAEVAILDELDKVHPVTGEMIPPQPDGYLVANHLWSAKDGRARIHVARNEFVAFQVLLRGAVKDVQPALAFEGPNAGKVEVSFGKYRHVGTKNGPLPDPLVPLTKPVSVPNEEEGLPGQKNAGLHCEIYVPHDAAPGLHCGRLVLTAGGETLTLEVSLHVWDFTLPDYLSFLPEMNCYGLPENERAYYRLAHRHRTALNRVPYSQAGVVARGCAPAWDGHRLDWSAWDRRFGPYFDGSAFADLPRKGVPLEVFYLPLHENWPSPMEGNYNGDYWADRAFPESYRRAFVEASRQIAEHARARGWSDTLFQCFFNGKVNYKERGWSRGSSPWLLDEPSSFQDYWALRYFGAAFREGISRAGGGANLVYRCDISRPQWQRNSLDGLLDYNVVGGAFRTYRRRVLDRKDGLGQLVIEYGTTNAVEASNMQPVGWSLDAWSLGADGVLPWQTIGRERSWTQADSLSLFYPGRARVDDPVPSIRLKSYRRGQQDVEYLTLWRLLQKEPRWAVGQRVRDALGLAGERTGSDVGGDEDPGRFEYRRLRPQDAWALRTRVGQALSDAKPEAKRKLVELRPPRAP
jgi:hypothetical protein